MNNTPPQAVSPVSFGFAPQARAVLKVSGDDRVDLLHRLSTQDLKALHAPGHVADTLFTTAQGKVLAWAQLFSEADALWLVCPMARVARLAQWIQTYTIMEDVHITDVTDDWLYFEAYGQSAPSALGFGTALTPQTWRAAFEPSCSQGFVTSVAAAMGPGIKGCLLKASWAPVERQLQDAGGQLLGPDALEQRRLLAGVPSSEYELVGEPNPLEMRLGPSCISWKKGCYIGQEVISRLDSYDKVARLLMGFWAPQALPRAGEQGHKLFAGGRPIGKITSSVATEDGCIGLALVKRAAAAAGAAQLTSEGPSLPITLVDRPFWAEIL